jgi:D-beta-D-heptose 7-phosphate kinase/D-beta-D-heptose 1-phosphate adenosyltransferase
MSHTIVVLGDVLLDRDVHGGVNRIAPDAPVPVLDAERTVERPGGAGLTALLCAAPDLDVRLIAPMAGDEAGHRLQDLLSPHVTVLPIGHRGGTRTKTRLRASGQCLLRLDEGGPGSPVDLPVDAVAEALAAADVILVSDYGAGTTKDPEIRRLLTRAALRTPVLWDPHPRGGEPVPGCLLVTPNLAEAGGAPAGAGPDPDELAEELSRRWQARAVCVTAGAGGAYLAQSGSEVLFVPARLVTGGDPCGAGDRFAASVAVSVTRGRVLSEAVAQAVEDASAWVAAGGTAAFDGLPPADPEPGHRASPASALLPGPRAREGGSALGWTLVEQHVAEVRAAGGRVVATGGCFDLLHVGHIACLQAARRAGDTLIVLLNSDASVGRLKGPERPIVPEHERAEVLAALACVDGVVVFGEDDPVLALDRLRPDVWVKGGDYGGAPMPEADLVRGWGGRVLLLPYLSGRSTTALLERADPDARDYQLEETR